MKKPELLAPAGSFEKAKVAFMYGADAVYCGTASLSLRSRAEVEDNDLEKTIKYAHSIGKKVYAALNIYAWDTNYEEIEKYSRIVTLDEIKENDYNLNISRYIDTTEEEEQIDVAQAIKELQQLEQERNEIEEKMYSFLKELGYCE